MQALIRFVRALIEADHARVEALRQATRECMESGPLFA